VENHSFSIAVSKSINGHTKEIDLTSVITMIVIRLLHKSAISKGTRKFILTISLMCARSA